MAFQAFHEQKDGMPKYPTALDLLFGCFLSICSSKNGAKIGLFELSHSDDIRDAMWLSMWLSMETGCSHGKVMRRDPIRLTQKLKWPNIWRARRQFQLFQCSFSFRFLWTLLDFVGFCWIFAILM